MSTTTEHIDPAGRVWHPYAVSFTSPDGAYTVEVWAISLEHAHLQVDALRETARVAGRIVSRKKA